MIYNFLVSQLMEGLQKKKGENKKENSKGKEKQNKKSSSDKVKRERVKKVYDLPGQKHDPPEEVCSSYCFSFVYAVKYDMLGNSRFCNG